MKPFVGFVSPLLTCMVVFNAFALTASDIGHRFLEESLFYQHRGIQWTAEDAYVFSTLPSGKYLGTQVDDPAPRDMEAFCQQTFFGTHWEPVTRRCKSDWNGRYEDPTGSLFDVWPLGFKRDPENPQFDPLIVGKNSSTFTTKIRNGILQVIR